MDMFNSFEGDNLSKSQAAQLCGMPYIFMVCCAYGAQLCNRGGRYHQEVTMNDEGLMVSTYVVVCLIDHDLGSYATPARWLHVQLASRLRRTSVRSYMSSA